MRGSKEHTWPTEPVRQAEPTVSDGQPRASGSTIPRDNTSQLLISGNSDTQPTVPDGQSTFSPGTTSETSSGINYNVLVNCNALVEGYRKGEVSKASVYFKIQSKLTKVFGDDRARTDAAFGSFMQPSRAMTPRAQQQLEEGEFSNRKSAPPALLYRFQMEDNQMSSRSPSESRSTSQHMHGSITDK